MFQSQASLSQPNILPNNAGSYDNIFGVNDVRHALLIRLLLLFLQRATEKPGCLYIISIRARFLDLAPLNHATYGTTLTEFYHSEGRTLLCTIQWEAIWLPIPIRMLILLMQNKYPSSKTKVDLETLQSCCLLHSLACKY